jgi:hypothetical protein
MLQPLVILSTENVLKCIVRREARKSGKYAEPEVSYQDI